MFDSYADLDVDRQFVKSFDEMYGEDAWEEWLEEWQEITTWTSDEMREHMPNMSTTPPEE
jgi:hypothetical protein